MKNFFAHWRTIARHRRLVRRYCFQCGLYWQGLTHDLSKYLPSEFLSGVKYFQGDRSPNDAERLATGRSMAWLRHKGRNPHHLEFWLDYGPPDGRYQALEMPLPYLVESVCDRLAASQIYSGAEFSLDKPLDYYVKSFPAYVVHEKSDQLFRHYLGLIATKGIDETMQIMKEDLAKAKRQE